MTKWVQNVKTVSTFPPPDTFNKPAKQIAKTLADPKVSPKGLGSAVRMVQYFINRGGKNLSAKRKGELEKAKHLLQEMNEQEKKGDAAKRNPKSHARRGHKAPRHQDSTSKKAKSARRPTSASKKK
jgi:tRNA(adenine34) deaminase